MYGCHWVGSMKWFATRWAYHFNSKKIKWIVQFNSFKFQNNQSTDKLHNSHIIINSKGDLVAVYRKLHLFDVETPEFRFQESRAVNGGDYIVTPLKDTPLEGGLGLQIVSQFSNSVNWFRVFLILIWFFIYWK